MEELFFNSVSGFYMMAIGLQQAMSKSPGAWPSEWLHKEGTVNGGALCGHMVNRTMYWPPDVPFEPRYQTDIGIEYHIGNSLTETRGSPNLKEVLQGTQRLHQRHSARGFRWGG